MGGMWKAVTAETGEIRDDQVPKGLAKGLVMLNKGVEESEQRRFRRRLYIMASLSDTNIC
jgi:hypothetical protein